VKYFLARHTFSEKDLVNEITPEKAMEYYRSNAGPGFLNLQAIPNFQKGNHIKGSHYHLWGEEIGGHECFRRILKGTLLAGLYEGV